VEGIVAVARPSSAPIGGKVGVRIREAIACASRAHHADDALGQRQDGYDTVPLCLPHTLSCALDSMCSALPVPSDALAAPCSAPCSRPAVLGLSRRGAPVAAGALSRVASSAVGGQLTVIAAQPTRSSRALSAVRATWHGVKLR